MTTAVQEAITRLHIVRAALDDTVPKDNPLASVEAYSAVENVLKAIVDETRDRDCERCLLIHANALHALLLAALLPILGLVPGEEHPLTETAFSAFAGTVEMLVEMHDTEVAQ